MPEPLKPLTEEEREEWQRALDFKRPVGGQQTGPIAMWANLRGDFLRALSDLAAAEKRIGELEEWVRGASHQPGCSGEWPPYPCKCGRPEILR